MDERPRNHGILTSDAMDGDEKIQLSQATDDEAILRELRAKVALLIAGSFPYELADAPRLLRKLADMMEKDPHPGPDPRPARDDRRMMELPYYWPARPLLALRRRPPAAEFATLVERLDGRLLFVNLPMHRVNPRKPGGRMVGPEDLDALFADGWRVD